MKKQTRRRKKLGSLLIGLGLILMLSALLLCVYNFYQSWQAGKYVREIVTILEEEPGDKDQDYTEENKNRKEYDQMPVKEINGYNYIGTIEIPSLNMKLPVMEEWDYNRLNISPCRYYGSYLTDDMVICGHNFSSHFGPLQNIQPGKDVYFVNVDDQTYHYIVACVDILNPFDVREMTHSDWDLSLFTCTISGQTRCTVRCKKAD